MSPLSSLLTLALHAAAPQPRLELGVLFVAEAPNVWVARGPELSVRLTPGEATFFGRGARPWKMRFGGGGAVVPAAERPSQVVVNEFLGNVPSRWRLGLRAFERVRYRSVYPGIDVVFHGEQGRVEYDLELQPGARPEQVRLLFAGADVAVSPAGDLRVAQAGRVLTHRRPVAYELASSGRRVVESSFTVLGGGAVGLRADGRDPRRALLIDPVLEYTSYLGASANDWGYGVAVDAQGNMFLAGTTASPDLPVSSAPWSTGLNVVRDGFVAKLSPAGARLFIGYIGGNADDAFFSVELDGAGNPVVFGTTFSTNYPTVAATQVMHGGSSDVMLTRVKADGTALLFSTFLGGSSSEEDGNVTVVGSDAYVVGQTASSDYPTVSPLRGYAGNADAFLTRIDMAASAVRFSTFYGGMGTDYFRDVVVDGSGVIYVTGWTNSADYPLVNPVRPAYGGGTGDIAFVRFAAGGSAVQLATWYGGAGLDIGHSLAVDGAGTATIVGETSSADFPVVAPLQPMMQGVNDGAVLEITSAPVVRRASWFGGTGADVAVGVAVGPSGRVVIAGTFSPGMPLTNPTQISYGGGASDGYIAELDAAGVVWSTYLGGSASDGIGGVSVLGNALYVAGETLSGDVPTLMPTQAMNAGLSDAFVARISIGSPADAGTGDAGTSDAGAGDAGAPDASVPDAGDGGFDAGGTDAGGTDAGGSDAGATDAGGTDGGRPASRIYQVQCGCSGAGGLWSLLLPLLAAAAIARTTSRRRPAAPAGVARGSGRACPPVRTRRA